MARDLSRVAMLDLLNDVCENVTYVNEVNKISINTLLIVSLSLLKKQYLGINVGYRC